MKFELIFDISIPSMEFLLKPFSQKKFKVETPSFLVIFQVVNKKIISLA
jgi:hypothetical protein